MTRLKIVFLFISIFVLRWYFVPSPLPTLWRPASEVRYTATILDGLEHTDTNTIIRSGIWYITILGYKEIIPGSRVRFVGKVEPQIVMGKAVRIVMNDAEMEVVQHSRSAGSLHSGSVLIALGNWRERWVGILQKNLPEPMASLAAGILLGFKGQMPREFYDQLVSTGTLHIIAASGFNVMIVASVLMAIAGKIWRRGLAIGVGIGGIVFYVLLAGASASVVRAGIMGSLTIIAYYFGRSAEARRLLWVSGGIMLLINPLMILDIGFQLSFGATIGLLYFEPLLQKLDDRLQMPVGVKMFIGNYLYPTLAASIATLPIIWWHFGRVSWISPLVNIFILPVVPLIMGMSALALLAAPLLASGGVIAWLAYVPLAYVVWVIKLFG